VEINPFDIGPEQVLRALTAAGEDQHAGIRVAEVAAAFEPQLLAVQESPDGGPRLMPLRRKRLTAW
jgi:hypothetical protein